MNLKRGAVREDGFVLNGLYPDGKEHWLSPKTFQEINFKHQKLRWKNKLKVIENYGGCCNHCGEKDPRVLQVDHVFDDGKSHVDSKGRRIGGSQLYGSIIKNNYQDCYQVLCANCNAKKEWIRRGSYTGEED
jgi:hypothetical protein